MMETNIPRYTGHVISHMTYIAVERNTEPIRLEKKSRHSWVSMVTALFVSTPRDASYLWPWRPRFLLRLRRRWFLGFHSDRVFDKRTFCDLMTWDSAGTEHDWSDWQHTCPPWNIQTMTMNLGYYNIPGRVSHVHMRQITNFYCQIL